MATGSMLGMVIGLGLDVTFEGTTSTTLATAAGGTNVVSRR